MRASKCRVGRNGPFCRPRVMHNQELVGPVCRHCLHNNGVPHKPCMYYEACEPHPLPPLNLLNIATTRPATRTKLTPLHGSNASWDRLRGQVCCVKPDAHGPTTLHYGLCTQRRLDHDCWGQMYCTALELISTSNVSFWRVLS